jgi:hypothetical protein
MKSRIDLLRACLPNQDGADEGGSRTEREISEIVKQLLSSQPGCSVGNNVWLDGCFEADIVITRVTPDGSESVFNIEVDGPSHLLPTKQRLSRLRGQHLQEACGVVIARIPLVKLTGEWLLRAEGFEVAVREVLQRLQLLQLLQLLPVAASCCVIILKVSSWDRRPFTTRSSISSL